MLLRMWNSWNFRILLMATQNGKTTKQNSLAFSYKITGLGII